MYNCKTSYSQTTIEQAERRLSFRIAKFECSVISLRQMLAETEPEIKGLTYNKIYDIKDKVYNHIGEFIQGHEYPPEANRDFKEANVHNLLFAIIIPIITAFTLKTRRNLYIDREKKILALNAQFSGYQEFVMVDMVGIGNQKSLFVVEVGKSSVREAKKHCLLVMKGLGSINGQGMVYGFVTTGEQWQMLRYNGKDFIQTPNFQVLFQGRNKTRRDRCRRPQLSLTILMQC